MRFKRLSRYEWVRPAIEESCCFSELERWFDGLLISTSAVILPYLNFARIRHINQLFTPFASLKLGRLLFIEYAPFHRTDCR